MKRPAATPRNRGNEPSPRHLRAGTELPIVTPMKTRTCLLALCSFAALAAVSETACAPAARTNGAGAAAAVPAAPRHRPRRHRPRRSRRATTSSRYANGDVAEDDRDPRRPRAPGASAACSTELTAQRTADLIAEAAKADAPAGSDARKIGDYYASFMDEAAIEAKGLAPLQPALERIAAIADAAALARALGAHAARRRRRAQQHELLHRQPVRPLGRAGPRRPRALLAVPAAGRPRHARPRLLPRRVAAHGGDPRRGTRRTSPPC